MRLARSYQKTERSIWAMEVRPVESIVTSNSLRRISRTGLTPGAPPAGNQHCFGSQRQSLKDIGASPNAPSPNLAN